MLRSKRWMNLLAHKVTLLVLLLGAALALAACGSSDGDDGGSSAAATGAAKRATGTPIKVGYVSPDLGAQGNTSGQWGAQAAVKRINDVEGGIDGHPIDLELCHMDYTPETNIGCANKLVAAHVVAVIDGFDGGFGAALPIFQSAKIPVVGELAFATQSETDAKSSFYFSPSQVAWSTGPFQVLKRLGLDSIVFAGSDQPGTHQYLDGFVGPAARSLGLRFQATYFPAGNPNLQTLAATIASLKPDVGGVPGMADEDSCTTLIHSLRNAGYDGAAFAGLCTAFIKRLGSSAGKAIVTSSVWLPAMADQAPADVQARLEQAESDLEGIGDPEKQGYWTYAMYSTTMTLAEILRSVRGEYTSASVAAALRGAQDVQSYLGPRITCDRSVWPKSSTCSDQLLIAETTDDGAGLELIGGGFTTIAPPAAG
jgi:branched-chain amino acid transport system substrate-binding protein